MRDRTILAIRRPDAVAWIVRYVGAHEDSFLLFAFARIGRKANMLSSIPIHIINHWFDEMESAMLSIIVVMRSD